MAEEIKKAEASDVERNKAMAIVGYIIQFLFFIPLITEEGKKSPFAKFHANQQLNLLLFIVVGWTAASILTIVVIGIFLMPIVAIGSLVFMIMGIISASKGEMKELPLIGGFKLIS
jgi:uncharacterized membrane protein